MGIIAHDLGMDLGTSNTLVYVKHKGIVVSEPTIVVVDSSNERKVRAVGDDAKIMLGRTTEGVMAVRPMREGVITDFDMTQIMIQYFMRKAIGSSYLVKPRLFLSYPCSISAIERRAVGEAAKYAGSRKVYLVEKPFLAALGSVFYGPAVSTLRLDIIPRDDMVRGQSVFSGMESIISMTGSAFSGVMVAFFGVPLIVVINGLSNLYSAVTEAFVNVPRTVQQGTQQKKTEQGTVRKRSKQGEVLLCQSWNRWYKFPEKS